MNLKCLKLLFKCMDFYEFSGLMDFELLKLGLYIFGAILRPLLPWKRSWMFAWKKFSMLNFSKILKIFTIFPCVLYKIFQNRLPIRRELCLKWLRWKNGIEPTPCPHGKNCKFAHGEQQLEGHFYRNFRTELCRFWNAEVLTV